MDSQRLKNLRKRFDKLRVRYGQGGQSGPLCEFAEALGLEKRTRGKHSVFRGSAGTMPITIPNGKIKKRTAGNILDGLEVILDGYDDATRGE